jgi:class 3 adenylate cyclase
VEERKLVTVVFCDLVGSTALSGALDPETLRSVTLRYFAAMRGPLERCGGTVEKFIGDAVMAVFGVPAMRDDDAARAASAALGMLDALTALNVELEPTLGVTLRVRIGVHTGPAVTTGDPAAQQTLVSGETVNIAARLEQNAEAGDILIGPVTRAVLGPAARVDRVGPVFLKGRSHPVTAYRLLGLSTPEPGLHRRFDLPYVGRVDELARLDQALLDCVRGPGSRLLAVYGEPGIGKTRLLRVWLERTLRPVVHLAARCPGFGEHASLAPLADALRKLRAAPAGRSFDADALATLDRGLFRDGTPGPSLDGACAVVAHLLIVAAQDQPVVLTIDDAHHGSDLLLDVLTRLVRMTNHVPVLVVCLARLDLPIRRPDWAGRGHLSVVVPPLTARECDAMVAALAEVSAHRAGPARPLDAAGGNPFHLEQLFAVAGQTDSDAVLPHGLQSLLGARLDALDPVDRTTLDLAAIVGREFTVDEVAGLARSGPEARRLSTVHPLWTDDALIDRSVVAALDRLGERRLVEPGEPGVVRFGNALIHEAAYEAMAKRTRADRHERLAAFLGERRAPAGTVATHLDRAYRYRCELGLRDDTTERLRIAAANRYALAGAQALAQADVAWAATLLQRAVDRYLDGEPGRATAVRQLGEVRIATGQVADGLALLRSVVATAREPLEAAHAELAVAVGDPETTVTAVAGVARRTLPMFEAAEDELGQARTRIRLAQERQLRGEHACAVDLLRAGLRHAVAAGAEPERALALGAVGISLWRGPTPVPLAIERSRELLGEHGAARPMVHITLGCPAAILLALDDRADDARELLARARSVADQLGYAEGAVAIPLFAAAVESAADQPRAALACLDRAAAAMAAVIGTAAGTGIDGLSGPIIRDAARILLDLDQAGAAARRLAGVAAGPTTGLLPADQADLDGVRARLAAAGGQPALALRLAEKSVRAAAGTDSPIVRAVAALDLALVAGRLDRPDLARASATEARRHFVRKGHRPGVRRADAVAESMMGAERVQ